MPVNEGKDNKGGYFRWGQSGKKYYYKVNNPISKTIARHKAWIQGVAMRMSGVVMMVLKT